MDVIKGLYEVIEGRKNNPEEGSYTCYLFNQGLDKILKKCGEECSEMIIASKNDDPEELRNLRLGLSCFGVDESKGNFGR